MVNLQRLSLSGISKLNDDTLVKVIGQAMFSAETFVGVVLPSITLSGSTVGSLV